MGRQGAVHGHAPGSHRTQATPPLFETLSVLGRDMTRRRLRACAEFLKKVKS